MKDFITADNVPFNWTERLSQLESYQLFVSDCFWMLKTDLYCEFYYNPCMFMGKIANGDMPAQVLYRIGTCSAIFKKGEIYYDQISHGVLQNTSIRFRSIERDMRIGNWFHAQGQNYATWKSKFICDDMYVEGLERECLLTKINAGIVFDMIRMGCQTRTPHYIKTVFDLSVFIGVDTSKINILPFNDTEWNATQWVKEFNSYSENMKKWNDKYSMSQIRNMRAEVFQHTVSIIKKGGYTIDGKDYKFTEDDSQMMVKETCYYDCRHDASSYPS